jgi:hypothetical protein
MDGLTLDRLDRLSMRAGEAAPDAASSIAELIRSNG